MSSTLSRPYRSHKFPACEICRKRKARCLIENPNNPCRLCHERGYECIFSSTAGSDKTSDVSSNHSGRSLNAKKSQQRPKTLDSRSSATADVPRHEASLLINTPMAEDLAIIEGSLTQHAVQTHRQSSRYRAKPLIKPGPAVCLRIPRWRAGTKPDPTRGQKQLEIIEQVLGVNDQQLVMDAFWDAIHPCFPVVAEHDRRVLKQKSSALLCAIYSISTYYCSISKASSPYDMVFLWNQTVSALHEEYLAPSIGTIQASLLAMMGRPTYGIQDNIVDCGRTVALAQGLGLHRNPMPWNMPEEEKQLRINIWWGVLVHDTWSSLAHGTPPLIRSGCYDVPIPTEDGEAEVEKTSSSLVFHQFCKLSEILVHALPHIYTIRRATTALGDGNLDGLRHTVQEWVSTLPDRLKLPAPTGIRKANGSACLHFCYLIVKLLLARLQLSVFKSQREKQDSSLLQGLCQAALEVATFTISLTGAQLSEFWLPYTSHLLVFAVITLLRCATEVSDKSVKASIVTYLGEFRSRLILAKAEYHWELGDFTLERCGDTIERMLSTSTNVALRQAGSHVVSAPVDLASFSQAMPNEWQLEDIESDLFGIAWDEGFDALDLAWVPEAADLMAPV